MKRDDRERALEALAAAGNHAADLDAVVFEHVSLAFDDKVVLGDITFPCPQGT